LTSEEYHRSELNIALHPQHPEHILPAGVPSAAKILDVGCGAGQTLIAAFPNRVSFGLDIDHAALKLGRSLTDRVRFVCGSAERLPYASHVFDMVVARVSLPYTNMDRSMREIRRVLRPGGTVWMTLHTFTFAWGQARQSSYKGWLFFLYIVLNSALLHTVQKQLSLFGRSETFQTRRSVRKLLDRHGFEDVRISIGQHFLVTARAQKTCT